MHQSSKEASQMHYGNKEKAYNHSIVSHSNPIMQLQLRYVKRVLLRRKYDKLSKVCRSWRPEAHSSRLPVFHLHSQTSWRKSLITHWNGNLQSQKKCNTNLIISRWWGLNEVKILSMKCWEVFHIPNSYRFLFVNNIV